MYIMHDFCSINQSLQNAKPQSNSVVVYAMTATA